MDLDHLQVQGEMIQTQAQMDVSAFKPEHAGKDLHFRLYLEVLGVTFVLLIPGDVSVSEGFGVF